jgi:hypothetical protein
MPSVQLAAGAPIPFPPPLSLSGSPRSRCGLCRAPGVAGVRFHLGAMRSGTVGALVGTKTDLGEERVVPEAEGRRFAEQSALQFHEASAKTGKGVQEAFLGLFEGALSWPCCGCGCALVV